MKVLFIGGTGIISSAAAPWAIAQGIDLYLLNRGQSIRPLPEGATHLRANINDADEVRAVLDQHEFDAVVNWIAFEPAHITRDIDLFRNRTGQYVFISSTSVYKVPVGPMPLTESAPLFNAHWRYSQQKIACEEVLMQAFRDDNFPVTIVRPAHTYDKTAIPIFPVTGGYTAIDRMKRGKEVLIPGDGTTLWTLTNHRDFAKGFVGLLGHPLALGEAVHITSDEVLTWNQIYEMIARAFGLEARFVHVPSDLVNAYDSDLGSSLLGDIGSCKMFDNTKIKRLVPGYKAVVPFHRGVEEIASWYLGSPARGVVDQHLDQFLDRVLAAYASAWPKK